MKYLRSVLKITRYYKIRNDDVRGVPDTKSNVDNAEGEQLSWLSHLIKTSRSYGNQDYTAKVRGEDQLELEMRI